MTTSTEELLTTLMKKEEFSWKVMLQELVRSEEMDPWDIDISLLAKKFLELLRSFQKMDLYISGKVVLAAALLLKAKSTRLIGDDLSKLDALFADTEDNPYYDEFFDYDEEFGKQYVGKSKLPVYSLLPRTPQPRKRKVSIYDLMDALQQAMEVKRRRLSRHLPLDLEIKIPTKSIDITQILREVLTKINIFFTRNRDGTLLFSDLLGSEPTKEDKVYTFVPLLHLSNQLKIDLEQEKSFGPIAVQLVKKK